MAIINGTVNNDILTVQSDTTSVQAGAGTDTVIFSGNYADYTFSQSDSYVPLMTNNSTGQVVSLFGTEQLQFDDGVASLQMTGSGEFLVNTYTENSQVNPSITALNNGGFVVTWESQDGDGYGVYAQMYDTNGDTQGTEFLVNTYTSNFQGVSSITSLTSGGFVVTWESDGQDGSGYGVYAQMYDADGTTEGSEFQLDTYTSNGGQNSSITALTDGGFVATWESNSQDGNEEIFAQIYSADGTTQGSEFQVNTYSTDGQDDPSIAALTSGGFVISWKSEGQDGDGDGIFAQMYNANGTIQGNEFQVNIYTSDNQMNPSIAALNDGGFVVAWISSAQGGQDGSYDGIFAQRYDENGNALGDEFQVNTHTPNNQRYPDIATLTAGGFVVTWESQNQDGSNYGIYAQCYDANGNTLGDEFQVNTYTTYSQWLPSITALNDGGFVVTWESYGQDADGAGGIYAQRYDAEGNPLGTNTLTFSTSPAIVTPIADTSTNEDAAYSYDASVNFTDVDANEVLTYSATLQDGNALPSWLSINSTTGVLSGTPLNDDVGLLDITVTATDAAGTSVSNTYALTINNTNDAPTLTSAIADAYFYHYTTYNYDVATHFNDVDANDVLTYSVTLANGSPLPYGLAIGVLANESNSMLNGWISHGVIDIMVTATDTAGASVSDTYTLTVDDFNPTNVTLNANVDVVSIDSGTQNVVIDVLANDGGGATYDEFFLADASGNLFNIVTLGVAEQYYLPVNGLIDEGTVTIDGVQWTQNNNGVMNDAGYWEADGPDDGFIPDDGLITSEGTNLTIVEFDLPDGGHIVYVSGTMVVDISGTFAFDEADTYTFTDINWTLVEDSNRSFSLTAEGTAMLNGEEVTFFSETTSSSLEITNVGSPTNGTVVIVGGALQYTPNAGYIGDDSFIYTMTDLATGDTSSSTVFLGILDSNDTFTLDPSINTIDGGYGNDTLTIGHTFVDYAVGISPDGTVIIRDANNNVTTITEVEDFSFSDQAFDIAGLQASDDVRELFYEMVSDGVGGYDQVYVLPELFYDPNNAGLNELFDYTYTKPADDTQGDIIIGSAGNEFINSSGGDDAVDAGAGNDIIDGGLGSNFLTGGIGNDIFFADGRDAAIVETWTTITDFNAGTNSASLWGYIDGTSHYLWEENQGAGTVGGVDYNGVTFRGDLDGNGVIDTSFTFTGLTLNDISVSTNSISNDIGETEYYYSFSLVA